MARVYRLMRKDADGLPLVEQSANGLGVREGKDVDVDSDGFVIANDKGMSVYSNWREVSPYMIPKRLEDRFYGAKGSNSRHVFRRGEGPFERGPFADGLSLVLDSKTHGVVVPSETMSLSDYQAALAETRTTWIEDEA